MSLLRAVLFFVLLSAFCVAGAGCCARRCLLLYACGGCSFVADVGCC